MLYPSLQDQLPHRANEAERCDPTHRSASKFITSTLPTVCVAVAFPPAVPVAVAVPAGRLLVLGSRATENWVVLVLVALDVVSCSCLLLNPDPAGPYLPLSRPFSLSAQERIASGSERRRSFERRWCRGKWMPSGSKAGEGAGSGFGAAAGEGAADVDERMARTSSAPRESGRGDRVKVERGMAASRGDRFVRAGVVATRS